MQDRNLTFNTLSQAIAYLLAGIFLFTTSSTVDMTKGNSLTLEIFGGIFMVFAFFLVIASCVDRLTGWANQVQMSLFLGLFAASMACLIVTAVGTHESLYIVLTFVFFLSIGGALLFQLFRQGTNLRTQLGSRVAVATLLRRIAFVLSLFALVMVISQIDLIGGPILYLSLGLVCLSISLLL